MHIESSYEEEMLTPINQSNSLTEMHSVFYALFHHTCVSDSSSELGFDSGTLHGLTGRK